MLKKSKKKVFFSFFFQLFEKKNQKSAQTIAQLQRKLEDYQKKLVDLEERGVHQKPSHRVKERVQVTTAGLPDSWCNIPKLGKIYPNWEKYTIWSQIYQMITKLPTSHKIYQMATKYTK
jgi:hypothetical protein